MALEGLSKEQIDSYEKVLLKHVPESGQSETSPCVSYWKPMVGTKTIIGRFAID